MSTIKKNDRILIGIISDTHGLLRPEAVSVLREADRIIHAGDIGNESVLEQLERIAPVVAVRGNMDSDDWAYRLTRKEVVEAGPHLIYVLHDIGSLDLNPSKANVNIVISGHTHRPSVSEHEGVLYVNPGSAGPRRPDLPVSVALLEIDGTSLRARIEYLDV